MIEKAEKSLRYKSLVEQSFNSLLFKIKTKNLQELVRNLLKEKQFHKLYEEATRKDGVTGENLLQFLERRLDNVVFRLGFSKTRRQARQVVSHGHVTVNGRKVNIASYRVKAGDVISLAEASRQVGFVKEAIAEARPASWLELDAAAFTGKVLQNPGRDAVDFELNEALIVEFYSR